MNDITRTHFNSCSYWSDNINNQHAKMSADCRCHIMRPYAEICISQPGVPVRDIQLSITLGLLLAFNSS